MPAPSLRWAAFALVVPSWQLLSHSPSEGVTRYCQFADEDVTGEDVVRAVECGCGAQKHRQKK